MNDPSPEFRLQQIKTRRLEIAATLSEWKRAWFVDGISRPIEDRLTLDAEAAKLALERRVIDEDALKAKLIRLEERRQTLLQQLIEVLEERGMSDVLEEAKARADQERLQTAES